jgi:hypothetical protein
MPFHLISHVISFHVISYPLLLFHIFIPFHSIPFIRFHSIRFHSIWFESILSHSFHFISFYFMSFQSFSHSLSRWFTKKNVVHWLNLWLIHFIIDSLTDSSLHWLQKKFVDSLRAIESPTHRLLRWVHRSVQWPVVMSCVISMASQHLLIRWHTELSWSIPKKHSSI